MLSLTNTTKARSCKQRDRRKAFWGERYRCGRDKPMKLNKWWDSAVVMLLIWLVWGKSDVVILLAVIAFLLYIVIRFHFFPSLRKGPKTQSINDDNEFDVNEFDVNTGTDGIAESQTISLDTSIDYYPCKNHF